ncbi:KH domain-containing protein [Candidatus Saccharibacteria bacterium]|nr:KH domain-containing protein [Candidatus Saccharibacteria bacterium]
MNNSIDQQFIEYIVKSLVGNPDKVSLERRIDEKGVLLELTVDPEDLGRVIGKRGATAQSLRTLLRALGTKNDARYNLKIVDNGEPRPPRDTNSQASGDDGNWGTSDDTPTDNPAAVAPVLTSDELDLDDDKAEPEENGDKMSKARKELEDLDDLDI